MHKYIDKRKLLRTPSERQRLLEEVPQVIPDIEDGKGSEIVVTAAKNSSQKSTGTNMDGVCLKSCSEEKGKGKKGERTVCLKSSLEEKPEAIKPRASGDCTPGTNVQKQGAEDTAAITAQVIDIDDDDDDSLHGKSGNMIDGSGGPVHGTRPYVSCSGQKAVKVKGGISEHTSVWYYNDPQGDERGPFTMELLRHWNNTGYFSDDFRVWKTGQSSDSAILLKDALLL
ncbi:hypothetical protein GUJ93_ZPchr0010g10238 [Zizania palustris]|uniref:GYF domain-containing protein n=1 Tax=Zizania palustris TaxID=103762 RepID=A0A8J5W926_ZIZPA|nr:hypothetical protein GUJ93_ZPchr0445g33603 [Zizania palustris]KAG8085635.1 hypothetical protein GUJ93_ZPchr0010g10238 [Zizania palustris]